MTDYISREAAKEAAWENIINRVVEEQGMYGYLCNLVNEVFDAITAADVVEVKRGKWISQHDGETIVSMKYGEPQASCFCSVCHEWLVASDEYDVKGNFCPNCGADMREEQT